MNSTPLWKWITPLSPRTMSAPLSSPSKYGEFADRSISLVNDSAFTPVVTTVSVVRSSEILSSIEAASNKFARRSSGISVFIRSTPGPPITMSLPSPTSIWSLPPIAGDVEVNDSMTSPVLKVAYPLSPNTMSRLPSSKVGFAAVI